MMELRRRSVFVYGLLAALWALVVLWQFQEHQRVRAHSRANLRNRSHDIADTLGAFIRGLQFRGAVAGDRIQPVLNELVGTSNSLAKAGEVLAVALLNAEGEPVASAGSPLNLEVREIAQEGERWGRYSLTVVYPVEGVSVAPSGGTNVSAPVLLPAFTNTFRDGGRGFRRDPRPPGEPPPEELRGSNLPPRPREGRPPGEARPMRPFWARGLNDKDYQALIQKRELHGVALSMSTDVMRAMMRGDLWTRMIIAFFASVAAFGSAFAWRALSRSSELEIRLVRASELNTHLKEMNLAAAGLAHETRNPLNIIRGLAQMISKQEDATTQAREKARDIINEADKVAAQLNEFINYSRPREVRRTALALAPILSEVVRALNYDLQEKQVKLQISGDPLTVMADDQLLRQALFNLLLNAAQAVGEGGEIHIRAERTGTTEAKIEIRDDGPGVPLEQRGDIFKPYFTTHKTGTGLGLAVVQQIVLAHGWEIECLANSPKGAIFRISHLELAPKSSGA